MVTPTFVSDGAIGTAKQVHEATNGKFYQPIQRAFTNLGVQLRDNTTTYQTSVYIDDNLEYNVDEVLLTVDSIDYLVGIPTSLTNLVILLNGLDIGWFQLNDDDEIYVMGFHQYGDIYRMVNGEQVVLFEAGTAIPGDNSPSVVDFIKDVALRIKNVSTSNSDQPFQFSPQEKNTVLAGPADGLPATPTFRTFEFRQLADTFFYADKAGYIPLVGSTELSLIPINLFGITPIFVDASTTHAIPAYTYDNGASGVGATITMSASGAPQPIDGIDAFVGMKFLFRHGSSNIHNGVYEWTTITGNAVATRTSQADETFKMNPQYVIVEGGDTLRGVVYQQQKEDVVIGTSSIQYALYGTPSDDNFVTLTGTQTLANKSFSDNFTTFIDNTDTTKGFKFQVSGISASTTRTYTVQDVNGTMTLQSGAFTDTRVPYINSSGLLVDSQAMTFQSGILSLGVSGSVAGRLKLNGSAAGSAMFSILAASDYTVALQVTGNTAITLPESGTLSTLGGSETLTNKTFGSITFNDATTISFNTTNGTKIGTSTSQKLAFYNSTPIVQPSGSVITALQNLGLVSSPVLNMSELTQTDVTTNDVSTSAHGFVPKAPNLGTQFLLDTGAWGTRNAGTTDADLSAVSTISFTGGSPPSGGTERYSWGRIGNFVWCQMRGEYTGAGSTNTKVTVTLPSTMPAPVGFTGWGNSEFGFGMSGVLFTAALTAAITRPFSEKDGSGNVLLGLNFNSSATTGWNMSFFYAAG